MSALGVNISTGDIVQQQSRGNWKVVTLINAVAGEAGADILSAGEDVSLYTNMTFEVQASAACVVYYQTSNDNINWFDPLLEPSGTDDVTDVTESYDVDTEKRSIKVTRNAIYIRVWVHCTGASTVTAKLIAQM